MRMMEIRTMTRCDLDAVERIAQAALGAGFVGDVAAYLDRTESYGLVALIEGQTAGFVLGERWVPGHLGMRFGRQETYPAGLVRADADGQLGVIQTIAVDGSHRGRGVGRKLFGGAESCLRRVKVRWIVVPAWTVDGRVHLGPLLDESGYHAVADHPDHWRDACERGEFHCPARRDGPCRCIMRLYARMLE